MADMLQFGMGIKKDDKKAYEIFSKLAGKGNIYAQFMSVQNHLEAKKYKVSTEKLEKLYQTGMDYYYGEHGKKRDYAMALTYFQQAAEKGYTEAQWIYKFGYGTTVDLKKAHYWIEEAAAQGNKDAISALKNRKW